MNEPDWKVVSWDEEKFPYAIAFSREELEWLAVAVDLHQKRIAAAYDDYSYDDVIIGDGIYTTITEELDERGAN